jgi:DNA-binding transcriptional LysR family regulator
MSVPQELGRNVTALPSRPVGINLSAVDLNLLVALEALLKQCNVTQAANTVGLSQPAMSRALSRLRGMFNDDLLVRTSAGYVRTIRGEQLFNRLPVTLDAVREIVSCRAAKSEDWRSTVRLAIPDHQALVLMTQIMAGLKDGPMNTEIVTEPLSANLLKRLENGELEMAVGEVDGTATGFFQRTLYMDNYACLVRHDHPALGEEWSSERFYGLRHAIAAPGQDVERGHLAEALADIPSRQRCMVSPNTMGAAIAVLDSDMILSVPRRVAAKMAALLPLRMLDLPIHVPPYEVKLLWHERSHRNNEHGWVRSQIAAAAHQGAPGGAAASA